jgi:predicted transposase/invertase (TIGR01784 family)
MASELLMEISQDERQRAIMRSRRMYETDRMSDLLTVKDEGRDEGRNEERRKNIKLMYNQLGLSVEVIAKAFGLSEQEVKDIVDSKAREQ